MLAAQPLADRLDLAPPATLVAQHRDWQGIKALDMAAPFAPGAQTKAPAGEIGDGAGILAAHARAMPWEARLGKGEGEQSGNKAVDLMNVC